jgi:hypothetical protein
MIMTCSGGRVAREVRLAPAGIPGVRMGVSFLAEKKVSPAPGCQPVRDSVVGLFSPPLHRKPNQDNAHEAQCCRLRYRYRLTIRGRGHCACRAAQRAYGERIDGTKPTQRICLRPAYKIVRGDLSESKAHAKYPNWLIRNESIRCSSKALRRGFAIRKKSRQTSCPWSYARLGPSRRLPQLASSTSS